MIRCPVALAAILLAALAKLTSQECITMDDRVSNIHGEMVQPVQTIPITECNPNIVVKDEPIALDTYENYLKIENNGVLPKVYANTFSRLPNLKTLVISQVRLENLEPSSLKGLSDLRYLNLKRNRIRTLPEHVLDDVPYLIELDLEYNQLQAIEQHLFDSLSNLKKLNLGRNHISQLKAQWYTGLHSLDYLYLAYNYLPAIRSSDFTGLSNLQTLRLQMNNISAIERDSFKGLSNLRSLSFEGTGLISNTDLQHELENMPNLRELSLNPLSYQCTILRSAVNYADENSIEVVQIPDIDICERLRINNPRPFQQP